jgi:nucleotide-binding universal stress UspA family protein
MAGSILVGVDFSPSSWTAASHAASLARRVGAGLVLCHAWNPPGWLAPPEVGPVGGDPLWLEDARRGARARLDSWRDDLRSRGVACEVRFEAGPASRQLVELAEALRPMLIAVGRRGQARLPHVLLGSVSERVASRSSVPVLVVPADALADRVPTRLLVGIDFSAASRAAFAAAAHWADQLGTEPRLIAVHCQPEEPEAWLGSPGEAPYRERWRFDASDLASWLGERADGPGVELRLASGLPESVLVELARDTESDWIVLGQQGRTALAAFLLGSTTDRVLRLTDRPVLVVPTSEAAAGEAAS